MCAATDALRTGAVLTGERGPKGSPARVISLVIIVATLARLELVAS